MPTSDPSKPLCYGCVHRLTIPGNVHTRCNNFEAKVTSDDPRGVEGGWFIWPLNFDPVWLSSCSGFSADEADKKPRREADPMIEILAMLRR